MTMDKRQIDTTADDAAQHAAAMVEHELFEAARAFAERYGFDEAVRVAAEGAAFASEPKARRHDH